MKGDLPLSGLGPVILVRVLVVIALGAAVCFALFFGFGFVDRREGLSGEAVDLMFFLYLYSLALSIIFLAVVCSWFVTKKRQFIVFLGALIGVLPILLFVLSAIFSFYFEGNTFVIGLRRVSGRVGDFLQAPGVAVPHLWGQDMNIFDPGLDDATVVVRSMVFACVNAISWMSILFLIARFWVIVYEKYFRGAG